MVRSKKCKLQHDSLLYSAMAKGACGYCSSIASKKCANCSLVFYCDRKCQKSDWKNHKIFCKVDLVPNILYPDDVVVIGHEDGAMIFSPRRQLNLHLIPISRKIFRVEESEGLVSSVKMTFHDNFADKYHHVNEGEDLMRKYRCRMCNEYFDTLEHITYHVRCQKCPYYF